MALQQMGDDVAFPTRQQIEIGMRRGGICRRSGAAQPDAPELFGDASHCVFQFAAARILDETWAHPAFAGRHVYARDDHELVCVVLAPAAP